MRVSRLCLCGGDGFVVVGILGDFLDDLDVLDLVVRVDDEDRAGEEAEFLDQHAVVLAERFGLEVGDGGDFVGPFGATEAFLGEGQVHADGVNDDVVAELGGFFVEAFGLHGADGGIDRGYDAEDARLALGGIQRHGFEAVADDLEVGGLVADFEFGADQRHGVALEGDEAGAFVCHGNHFLSILSS